MQLLLTQPGKGIAFHCALARKLSSNFPGLVVPAQNSLQLLPILCSAFICGGTPAARRYNRVAVHRSVDRLIYMLLYLYIFTLSNSRRRERLSYHVREGVLMGEKER